MQFDGGCIDIMMHAVMVGTGRNVMEGGVVVVLFGDNFFRSEEHTSDSSHAIPSRMPSSA